MKIKAESLPVRCDICHQSDEFDAGLNRCRRCRMVVPDTVRLSLKSTKSEKEPSWVTWVRRIQTGLTIWFISSILLILSAFTPICRYLVWWLPIDPDWILLAREFSAQSAFGLPILITAISFILPPWRKPYFPGVCPKELFIVTLIIAIWGAVALPSLTAPRRTLNCIRAVRVLKKIRSAQEVYRAGPGRGDYAKNLALLTALETPVEALNQVEARLGNVGYYGYHVVSFHTFPATETAPARYEIQLAPTILTGKLRSGNDAYFLDQTGNIRHSGSPSQLADANSDPVFY